MISWIAVAGLGLLAVLLLKSKRVRKVAKEGIDKFVSEFMKGYWFGVLVGAFCSMFVLLGIL